MHSVMIHRVVAMSCMFGLVGCSGDGDVSTTVEALWSPSGTRLWPDGRVNVCFLPSNPTTLGWHANVQSWVTSQIQPFAHVTFSGFGACPANPGQSWIKLEEVERDISESPIGYVNDNRISFGTNRNRQGIVLHEFMHALGFQHEFERPVGFPCSPRELPADPNPIEWSPFDPDSIMNSGYCHEAQILSRLDRAGLRAAYGDEDAPELAGSVGRRMAVSRNADGRLELFYGGPNQALYHTYQISTGWSGPQRLGTSFAKQMVVAPNLDGRLELVYIGTDDRLYHNYQTTPNGSWSGEVVLAGSAKQITLGRNASGTLELFYVGTDNLIYHNWQTTPNGAWFGQVALRGAAKQVAVARTENGGLELFYIGMNDLIHHQYQIDPGGVWSAEYVLGGSAKQLLVHRNKNGPLEIFYIGTNNVLYHRWFDTNGWTAELPLFGSAKRLSVVRNADGRMEIFYVGTNDAIYHDWQTSPPPSPGGVWSKEFLLGGLARDLVVNRNSNSNGSLEVFYIGLNGFLYHNWQTPSGNWNGEALLGGDVNDPPPPPVACPADGACLTTTACHQQEGINLGQLSCPASTTCCVFDEVPPSCPANGACLTATECHHQEGTNAGQRNCPAASVCCTF